MAVGKTETHGVLRVMGHGERVDLEVAEAETAAGFEDVPIRPPGQSGLHRSPGALVGEDADVRKTLQALESVRVVAVFVGQEDGVDPRERFPHLLEQLTEPAGGKPGVDEHAGALGHEQRGVTRAAAAKDREPHRHGELMGRVASHGPDKSRGGARD